MLLKHDAGENRDLLYFVGRGLNPEEFAQSARIMSERLRDSGGLGSVEGGD